MCRHIFAVSKQVALAYKCVILRKPHLQKYLEFSLKNLGKNGNFSPKTMRKPGIWFEKKNKNPVIEAESIHDLVIQN